MPFNMHEFTEQEEAAAWAGLLAEYETLRVTNDQLRRKLAQVEAGQWTGDVTAPAEPGDWAHLSVAEMAEELGISELTIRPALEKAMWWRALAYRARDERRVLLDRPAELETRRSS